MANRNDIVEFARAPTATDSSSTMSVKVGTMWHDTSNNTWFMCLGASPGAAVWKQVSTELSTAEMSLIDGVTAGTAAASKAVTLDASGNVTWVDGGTINCGATTGVKIGTAVTEKIGFWGVTPVVQPADADQADQGAMTTVGANTGTAGAGLSLIGDTTVVDQAANLMNDLVALQEDIAAIDAVVTAIRTALVNAGIIKGAA